ARTMTTLSRGGCEALREDDLARLRCYPEQPLHGARFSTWLVTQETCSNPPAAVRLKERAETSTVPTRTLRRLQARRVHEVRIRTRRAAARARPGQLPRRLDQRAHPAGPPRSARFAA